MIDLWLRSGTVGIVVLPFIVLYAIAVGIVWLTHKSAARPYFASCVGITGPFFASVAVMFGLFAAFLANDVQRRDSERRQLCSAKPMACVRSCESPRGSVRKATR